MHTDTQTQGQPQPNRSRAVFSQDDFELIRTAIAHYLQDCKNAEEGTKYSHLYHRLGRLT